MVLPRRSELKVNIVSIASESGVKWFVFSPFDIILLLSSNLLDRQKGTCACILEEIKQDFCVFFLCNGDCIRNLKAHSLVWCAHHRSMEKTLFLYLPSIATRFLLFGGSFNCEGNHESLQRSSYSH
jgi:hypothetical protein